MSAEHSTWNLTGACGDANSGVPGVPRSHSLHVFKPCSDNHAVRPTNHALHTARFPPPVRGEHVQWQMCSAKRAVAIHAVTPTQDQRP